MHRLKLLQIFLPILWTISNHSMGVAEGAEKISRFMGFDEDICQKMYIAGALHDIGKVAIGNEILEKPEKLTDEEFKTMKHHAVL